MMTGERINKRSGDGPGAGWAEVAPVALIGFGADGRPTACNERWREYAGLVSGDPIEGWFERIHPEDERVGREGIRRGVPFEATCRLRGGDGRHRWFRVRAAPGSVGDGNGDEAGGWVAACWDVDDLVRSREELERSNADLERFAAVAAHDLQEPLRKVRAFGERLVARRASGLDDGGREHVRRMCAAVDRMSGLIRGVLDYSRLNGPAGRSSRVELTAIAEEVISDLCVAIEWRGGWVAVETLPAVMADPTQMRQLLQNLIANALKYARPGEPPRVRVRGWTEPGRCVVEVIDDGQGFALADAERIFEPFQRLNAGGGSGLGLAICRRIVERHGGSIVAEGVPGAGAVFRVILPDDSTAI